MLDSTFGPYVEESGPFAVGEMDVDFLGGDEGVDLGQVAASRQLDEIGRGWALRSELFDERFRQR